MQPVKHISAIAAIAWLVAGCMVVTVCPQSQAEDADAEQVQWLLEQLSREGIT